MKNSKKEKLLAKNIVSALNNVLKLEANSTSCFVVYQPRMPKELSKFRTSK